MIAFFLFFFFPVFFSSDVHLRTKDSGVEEGCLLKIVDSHVLLVHVLDVGDIGETLPALAPRDCHHPGVAGIRGATGLVSSRSKEPQGELKFLLIRLISVEPLLGVADVLVKDALHTLLGGRETGHVVELGRKGGLRRDSSNAVDAAKRHELPVDDGARGRLSPPLDGHGGIFALVPELEPAVGAARLVALGHGLADAHADVEEARLRGGGEGCLRGGRGTGGVASEGRGRVVGRWCRGVGKVGCDLALGWIG